MHNSTKFLKMCLLIMKVSNVKNSVRILSDVLTDVGDICRRGPMQMTNLAALGTNRATRCCEIIYSRFSDESKVMV